MQAAVCALLDFDHKLCDLMTQSGARKCSLANGCAAAAGFSRSSKGSHVITATPRAAGMPEADILQYDGNNFSRVLQLFFYY